MPSSFFNDTATPEIYTLSLPDALPIWPRSHVPNEGPVRRHVAGQPLINRGIVQSLPLLEHDGLVHIPAADPALLGIPVVLDEAYRPQDLGDGRQPAIAKSVGVGLAVETKARNRSSARHASPPDGLDALCPQP